MEEPVTAYSPNQLIDGKHTQAEIDAAWDKEIARRSKEIDDGTAVLIPAREVFAKTQRELERIRK